MGLSLHIFCRKSQKTVYLGHGTVYRVEPACYKSQETVYLSHGIVRRVEPTNLLNNCQEPQKHQVPPPVVVPDNSIPL